MSVVVKSENRRQVSWQAIDRPSLCTSQDTFSGGRQAESGPELGQLKEEIEGPRTTLGTGWLERTS